MRRLVVVAVLSGLAAVVAGCSSADAGAESDPACDPATLVCGLLDADVVESIWPVEADFEPVGDVVVGADPQVWCEQPPPSPAATERRFLRGVDGAGTPVGAVVSTASLFDGDGAEATLDAVGAIPQGCVWEDGAASFQLLETDATRGYGDDTLLTTMRSVVDGNAQIVEQVWIRVDDTVLTVSVLPALDRADVLDQLVRAAVDRADTDA